MTGIEGFFLKMLMAVAAGSGRDAVHAGLRALMNEEIYTADPDRFVTQPFRTAGEHLKNAELEVNEARRRQHIEYARLEFMKATGLDAPLSAARAAAYVGLCHHLFGEPIHEFHWYRRTMTMLDQIDVDLTHSLTRLEPYCEVSSRLWRGTLLDEPFVANRFVAASLFNPVLGGPVLAGLLAASPIVSYRRTKLSRQLEIVRRHKEAVQQVIAMGFAPEPSSRP